MRKIIYFIVIFSVLPLSFENRLFSFFQGSFIFFPAEAAAQDSPSAPYSLAEAINALESDNEEERLLAVNRLVEIGGDGVIEPLAASLRDPSSEVRFAAEDFFDEMIDDEVERSRKEGDISWSLKHMILSLLSVADEAGVFSSRTRGLLEHLFDEMADNAGSAGIGTEEAINALNKALEVLVSSKDYDRLFTRRTAMNALSSSIKAYSKILRSPSLRKREKGATGFAELFQNMWSLIGDEGFGESREIAKLFDEMAEALGDALTHKNPLVRLEAAEMGVRLLESARWSLRSGDARAKRLKSDIFASLSKLIEDNDPEISSRAKEAMEVLEK